MQEKLVLVVDDDAGNRELIRQVVETLARARTAEAGTGLEALDLVRQKRPDLILLDVYLPDLHGSEVARRLRASPATAGIPIVAVSAHCVNGACPADMVECDGCVPKPFEIDYLVDTVRRFLGSADDRLTV